MNTVGRQAGSQREREQIAEIVGCRMVGGACVTHQPRDWEARRPGCPYVDALMGYAGSKVSSQAADLAQKHGGTTAA